jgi:hypothetical protein
MQGFVPRFFLIVFSVGGWEGCLHFCLCIFRFAVHHIVTLSFPPSLPAQTGFVYNLA